MRIVAVFEIPDSAVRIDNAHLGYLDELRFPQIATAHIVKKLPDYRDDCNYEEDNYGAGWNHCLSEIES